MREVVETARSVTGRPIEAIESPRRAGDPPILVAFSEKIQGELGWTLEKLSLGTMIADAWNCMQGHPCGYEEG